MFRRIKSTGSLLKQYLKANNVSQRHLAELSGYTEKQVSLILNDVVLVSPKFANAVEETIDGIQASFILKYQKIYQEQRKKDEIYLTENNYKTLSKAYDFKKIFKNIDNDSVVQTERVNEAFGLKNLRELEFGLNHDELYNKVAFSKDSSKLDDRDNKVVTIWTKVAMKQMTIGLESKTFVGPNETKRILEENKELLNVTDSCDLMNNLTYICDMCGIHIGFSKSAPTSFIRGLSFSINGEIFIVITDRFKKIEYVVFAFVHEMEHIINGDISMDSDCIRFTDDGDDIEELANDNARKFLIDDKSYTLIADINNPKLSEIYAVANSAKCSVGTVVARIHFDTKDYTKYWQYLNKFVIEYDMFGN